MSDKLPLGEAEPPLMARMLGAAPLTLRRIGMLVQPIGCIRGSGLSLLPILGPRTLGAEAQT
jgi:hypothetical protein